jgi:hypothetical protein
MGSQLQAFAPIATGTNTLNCGAHTCAALACTSMSNSGTLSSTAAATFGAMSCSSLASTGLVSQPQYWARSVIPLSSTQSLSGGVVTQVVFPTAGDTLSSTWGTRTSTDGYVVPAAGLYSINASIAMPSVGGLNVVQAFLTQNDSSPSTSTSTYYGQDRYVTPNTGSVSVMNLSAKIQCSAGDTLRPWLMVGGGVTLGSASDRSVLCSLQIDWAHP